MSLSEINEGREPAFANPYTCFAADADPSDEDALLSFAEVHLKYKDKIYNFILNKVKDLDDAEELASATFFNAYKHFTRFRGECKISTWLWQIAANQCKNKFRERDRRHKHEAGSLDAPLELRGGTIQRKALREVVDPSLLPDEVVLHDTSLHIIFSQIEKLPENYRTVIVMCDLDEMSYQDISNKLNISLQSTKTRIHRGRILLRKRLKALLWE